MFLWRRFSFLFFCIKVYCVKKLKTGTSHLNMGSRVGAVVKALASHQCGPGSIPGLGVICGLSLLLVLYPAPIGFSPGTPVFPSPQKPTFPNSNSIRMQNLPENHFAVSGASWVNIMIYLISKKKKNLLNHQATQKILPKLSDPKKSRNRKFQTKKILS